MSIRSKLLTLAAALLLASQPGAAERLTLASATRRATCAPSWKPQAPCAT